MTGFSSAKLSKMLLYYAASFIQGLVLICLPGASFLITSPEYHALSDTQYGLLFLPMIAMAALMNSVFPKMLKRVALNRLFYVGLMFNILYLLCFFATAFCLESNMHSFVLLMLGSLLLGIGFGLLITTLTLFVVALYPHRRNVFVSGLHALFCAGASVAPLLVKYAFDQGYWMMFPIVIILLIGLMLIGSSFIRIGHEVSDDVISERTVLPKRGSFPLGGMIFLISIFFYGVLESIITNWSPTYLAQDKNFSVTTANGALSMFWAFMTVGRAMGSIASLRTDARWIYRCSPVVIFVALGMLLWYSTESNTLVIYAVIGWGCSNYFPFSVTLSTGMFDDWRETLASFAIVALMTGIGVGSSLLGLLQGVKWMTLEQGIFSAMIFAGLLIVTTFLSTWVNLSRNV